MAKVKPKQLVLRCYGHRKKKGNWYGICIDLNLATEANSLNELKRNLRDVVEGYLETVYDTKDKDSIPKLLNRPAPLKDRIRYYFFKTSYVIHKFKTDIAFNQFVPIHLPHRC